MDRHRDRAIGRDCEDGKAARVRCDHRTLGGPPPASGFDLIVMNHVLEHVGFSTTLIQAAAESLPPEDASASAFLTSDAGNFVCLVAPGGRIAPEHVWFLEKGHALALVDSAGLRPVAVADLSRAASVLRPSIWRQQWSTWRVADGSVAASSRAPLGLLGLTGRGARGSGGAIHDVHAHL